MEQNVDTSSKILSIIGWIEKITRKKTGEKKCDSSSLDYTSGKLPPSSVLSMLPSGIVLDVVKVSDSEKESEQDTDSIIVECEESFYVLYFEIVWS